jgi:DNA-binding transcriptional LysR family regulator
MRDDRAAGVVKLTAPPWLAERLIIPAVPAFRDKYPELELRVHTSHEIVDIAARDADLALRNVRPTRGRLVCKRIGELAGCVYASEMYLERRGVPADRAALRDHDLLVYEGRGGMPGFEWLSEPAWRHRVAFRAGDPVGLMSAAASGMGLAAIPCILGETDPALRRVESLGVGYSPLYLVTHEELHATARLRVVWRLVEHALRANESTLMGRGEQQA